VLPVVGLCSIPRAPEFVVLAPARLGQNGVVLRANGMRSEYLGKFRSILGTVSAVKHAQEAESTVVNMFEIEKAGK